MDINTKSLALLAGMKLKEIYPDENKNMGWVHITCTEFELERYTYMIVSAYAAMLTNQEFKINEK
jgi:hypothetical protein